MSIKNYLLQLVRDTLGNSSLSTSAVIRNCKRIATMRADYENLWWIECELHEIDEQKRVSDQFTWRFNPRKVSEIGPQYSRLWLEERQINKYDSNFNIVSHDNIIPFSVGRIEARIRDILNQSHSLPATVHMHTLDAYYTEQSNAKARMFIVQISEELEQVLNKIRTRAFDYLIDIEGQLMRGSQLANYFDENKNFVISELTEKDKSFQQEFDKLEDHFSNGTDIDFSEALLDVRRILSHFADIVCPPSAKPVKGNDGKEHKLTEDKYLNRIKFAIFQNRGKHTVTELLDANLTEMCNRLEKLNELSCKGVHSNVSREEAYQSVTQMYLMLGELIRMLTEAKN